MPKKLDEKGVVHVVPFFLILTVLGLVLFLLITSVAPSQNNIFNNLFPKKNSEAATNQIYWGAWVWNANGIYGIDPKTGKAYTQIPWDADLWDLYEQHAGKAMSLVHWGANVTIGFDFVAARNARNRGAIPYLDLGTDGTSDKDVASGVIDQTIKNWASQVKTNYPFPIFIRLDGEMQGCWEYYGPYPPGCTAPIHPNNTPADYIAMWKHIHDVVEIQSNVTNITWVWCPNNETAAIANETNPSADINNIANWFPSGKDANGHDYVDWTCFDAYNFGGNSWETWDQAALPVYNHLLKIAPNKPIMVGETGSAESNPPVGTSKALWLTDQLGNLATKYPQIKAYDYFNVDLSESGTIREWPIESSAASQNAFAQSVAASYFASNNFGVNGTIPLDSNGKIQPLSSLATPLPTVTPSLNPNMITLSPVADTYVASDVPDSTFGGTAGFLYTNGDPSITRKTFMRFDLSSTVGKTLTAATLRVTTTGGSDATSKGTINARFVSDDSWKEQFMSWNNTISPSSIDTSTAIGILTGASSLNTSYDIVLNTSRVQSQIGPGGDGMLSLEFDTTSADSLVINSREASTGQPQLILTFVPTATPTPIPTTTPTKAATPTPIVTPTGTPTSSPSICQGADTDKNGAVNIFDYNQVVSDFGKTGPNFLGDVNKDGTVNIFDYNIIVANFGKTGC